MNPTTAQGLDPKLKETYDRVMGTQVNPPSAPKPAEPVQSAAPVAPHVPIQPSEPVPAAHAESQVFVASPSTSPQNFVAKKSHKISPVIFMVLGIAFFGVYTVVWLKVFGII